MSSPAREAFKATLAAEMLGADAASASASAAGASGASEGAAGGGGGGGATRILSFSRKPAAKTTTTQQHSLRSLYAESTNEGGCSSGSGTGIGIGIGIGGMGRKGTRYVSKQAERVLDAPELVDDYYLNLIDWSPANVLAVALGAAVYLWDSDSGSIRQLVSTANSSSSSSSSSSGEDTTATATANATGASTNMVTSVKWMRQQGGTHLAVGTAEGEVQLWDVARGKQLRTLRGHSARVGALSWNGCLLATGARDASVRVHDVRLQHSATAALAEHSHEVCGLEWSPSGLELASGANDNLVKIWQPSLSSASKFTFDHHLAAVKAIAWCPWQQGLLATGGGSSDRTIKFWNTQTGVCINSVDTHSQVTSIQWSTNYRELISSHGYSQNQLIVWKYPTMEKVCELSGHESRILCTSRSPDGSTIVSAAADETLRFWNVWPARSVATQKTDGVPKDISSLRYQLLR
jgi:cell division cycle protein 20 (cofactor of APC complex)